MKLTPTECKPYITKSMDTFYKAMKRGDLNYEVTDTGRKIDFSELQRWHEENYGPLNKPNEAASESVSSDIRSDKGAVSGESSGADAEAALLKMRLEMIEEERKRERELLQEQIEDLRASVKDAREERTLYLTDQRSAEEKKEKEEMVKSMNAMKAEMNRLRREVEEGKRGLFERWLGGGKQKKAVKRRPVQQSA